MGNIPNTNTPNLVLQSVGNGSNDSRWGTSGGGSGITQLTGDVTAGPGSGSQAATVVKINGTALGTLTGATNGYVLTWNSSSSTWVAAAGGNTLGGYAVNVSALNPTTDTGAMLTFNYNSFTGLSQWVETYVPTGTGSMFFWNGTNWESTSTTGIATGNVLVWNNSTSKWVPGNITLAGDVTGATGANTVVKLQNYPVNVVSIAHGEMLWWSNISGYQQFITGPQPITTGQYYAWDTTLGGGYGGWNLSSAGGGITNDAQYGSNGSGSVNTVAGITPQGLPSAVFTTAMSGFTKYQITASIGIRSTSATTSYMQIHNGSSLIGIPMAATLSANAVSTITNTIVVSGYSSGTSYSFYIYANVQNGTGTHTGAVITAIGIQ